MRRSFTTPKGKTTSCRLLYTAGKNLSLLPKVATIPKKHEMRLNEVTSDSPQPLGQLADPIRVSTEQASLRILTQRKAGILGLSLSRQPQ